MMYIKIKFIKPFHNKNTQHFVTSTFGGSTIKLTYICIILTLFCTVSAFISFCIGLPMIPNKIIECPLPILFSVSTSWRFIVLLRTIFKSVPCLFLVLKPS